jgi:hypothetical protein
MRKDTVDETTEVAEVTSALPVPEMRDPINIHAFAAIGMYFLTRRAGKREDAAVWYASATIAIRRCEPDARRWFELALQEVLGNHHGGSA